MPKEFLYGSDKRVPGFGLILASSTASQAEKKWISENSVYTRIGSREESPVSWAFSRAGNNVFLSRSCASIDYSGRPSFLANHLELSQEEMLLYEDGPAYILSRYRFIAQTSNLERLERNTQQFLNRFDGCREENSRCGTWQSLLSVFRLDGRSFAGAAAILVSRGVPVYIVYSQNQREEIIPLFRELWSLLPVSCRWQYTFNTYLSNLGTVYSLNGLLKEADQTAQFCQSGKAFYLDLSTGAHNFPAEIFDASNLTGIERFLMTGNVAEAQENYEQIPDFPATSCEVWEEQTELVQKLQAELLKVREELAAETSVANAELASLKEINTRYKNNAERLKNDLNSLENRNKEEEEKNVNLRRENETLSHRNAGLKQEIEQAQNQLQAVNSKWNEAKNSVQELQNNYQTSRNKCTALMNEIQIRTNTNEHLRAEIEVQNTIKTRLTAEIEGLNGQKEGLQTETSQLQKEKSELERDLQILKHCSQKKSLYKNLENIRKFSEDVLLLIQNLDQKK